VFDLPILILCMLQHLNDLGKPMLLNTLITIGACKLPTQCSHGGVPGGLSTTSVGGPRAIARAMPALSCCKYIVKHDVTSPKLKRTGRSRAQMLKTNVF